MKNTMKDKILIGTSIIQDLFTWVYAAYAVHSDMLSQTGGYMLMGWVVIHENS